MNGGDSPTFRPWLHRDTGTHGNRVKESAMRSESVSTPSSPERPRRTLRSTGARAAGGRVAQGIAGHRLRPGTTRPSVPRRSSQHAYHSKVVPMGKKQEIAIGIALQTQVLKTCPIHNQLYCDDGQFSDDENMAPPSPWRSSWCARARAVCTGISSRRPRIDRPVELYHRLGAALLPRMPGAEEPRECRCGRAGLGGGGVTAAAGCGWE